MFFSLICQHASRHQPQQSAQFPAHQPALHPAMITAVNRDTNRTVTTPPQLHHSPPLAPIIAPAPVQLQAAPRHAATQCTTRALTPTVNAITHLDQSRDLRNTTSSINITGRTKRKLRLETGILEGRERNVLDCCSVLSTNGVLLHVRKNNYIAPTVFKEETYHIKRSGRLEQNVVYEYS